MVVTKKSAKSTAGDPGQVPARLRARRLSEGLTQGDLAKKLGVSQALVSMWETGRVKLVDSELRRLEQLLGRVSGTSTQVVDADESRLSGAFGAWLRQARAKLGYSVAELASQSGLSSVAIYNLESGRSSNPQRATRERLEKALKTSVPVEVSQEAAEEQLIEGLGALEDFDPHATGDLLPKVPGVYVFYDVSDRPVYVGQAKNIAARVRQHADKFWFKRPIVESAAYIGVSGEALRNQLEQVLIKFLKRNAVLNRQSVERQ